jgi:hypothetical protein
VNLADERSFTSSRVRPSPPLLPLILTHNQSFAFISILPFYCCHLLILSIRPTGPHGRSPFISHSMSRIQDTTGTCFLSLIPKHNNLYDVSFFYMCFTTKYFSPLLFRCCPSNISPVPFRLSHISGILVAFSSGVTYISLASKHEHG